MNLQYKKPTIIISILLALGALISVFYLVASQQIQIYGFKKSDTFFEILAKKYPLELNDYLLTIKESFIKKEDEIKRLNYTHEFIHSLFVISIYTASKKSLYHYFKKEVELDKKLFQVNPELVLLLETKNKLNKKLNTHVLMSVAGKDLLNETTMAKKNVIRSAIENPQPSFTRKEIKKLREIAKNISAKLTTEFGEKATLALEHPDDPSIDPKFAAAVRIGLYEKILEFGEDQADMIFRYIFRTSSM